MDRGISYISSIKNENIWIIEKFGERKFGCIKKCLKNQGL